MRVDNGEPLGSSRNDTTSVLAMWLIANDIDMIFNRPACPESNGKVERIQGTSARWAEIYLAKDLQDLQARLNKEVIFQREKFVVSRLGKQTRLQAFPALETSRRVFKAEYFSVKRVYEYIARKVYRRWVSKYGQIFIFGQRFSVGRDYKGQYVHLRLNSDTCQWEVSKDQKVLKRYDADRLSEENIRNLTVYRRK